MLGDWEGVGARGPSASWLSVLLDRFLTTAIKTMFDVASHQHYKPQLRLVLKARSFF